MGMLVWSFLNLKSLQRFAERLATRPRVTGKAIERILGHAVHLCMLRREVLSMFRCLYDFVHHSHDGRKRLWTTAGQEARWATRLKLCTADLTRPWDSEITCSDASLSGIAVCRCGSSRRSRA